jgi:two-component system cell cycle sensor histidine kinase/response regulator CckA
MSRPGGEPRATEAADLALLFDAIPGPVVVLDAETLWPLAVNADTLKLFGYDRDAFMGMSLASHVITDVAAAQARIAGLGDADAIGTTRYRRKDGSEFVAEYTARVIVFRGRPARIAVIRPITARMEAEATRAVLAAIVTSSTDAIVSKRSDGVVLTWNPAAERMFGYSAAEMIGGSIDRIIPPERLTEERELVREVLGGRRIDAFETVRRRKDGTSVEVAVSLAPVLDPAGVVVAVSKTVRDLTPTRAAAAALARTELQLRHAQKMEAVGRLAGGVAHDFNNLLSVILTYSALVLDDLPEADPLRRDVLEIEKAGSRAAELTRQLLAFSRQTVVQPRVLDLNEVLAGMEDMLARLVGEDVDLTFVRMPGLGCIKADPSGVEQVIMNLVVNARDAMPTGGRLTIETGHADLDDGYVAAHPGATVGPHAVLSVTDTGTGMDAATQSRIFDPFFTTKPVGKGTGLGLSTVFGIVNQSGGTVWVYSEPGCGSTFKVYYPRVPGKHRPVIATEPANATGTETILLVEDQEQVRGVAEQVRLRCGYRVLVATHGADALRVSAEHSGPIHLVLTDVVMPGMSGAELIERLSASRPGIRTLCMSGYTDDSVVRHGVLERGVAYLQKPFNPDSLSRKVREVLDAGL